MSPSLPVELYVQILRELPVKDQSTLTTIASFLSTSTLLRAAALEALIWEGLYQARYPNCDDANEKDRRDRLHGNIRLMFIERRKTDREALRLLDLIRTDPENNQGLASRIVQEMSFDVWDVLELEIQLAIPKVFRNSDIDDMEEDAAPHALPRRFWAKALRGAIARYYAVKKWIDVRVHPEDQSFDDVLLGFSAFMDFSPKETIRQLDEMAVSCRQRLYNQGVQVDSGAPDYDLVALVIAIRDFIHHEGFAVASGQSFMNPLNQFAHHFLGPGRSETLPMSINWVFTALCRRLGVQAGPTNTPGRVFCHITSHAPQHSDMLFDVCTAAPPVIFSSNDVATMLAEAGMPADVARPDAVLPAELPIMLRRAAYNIFSATRTGNIALGNSGDTQRRADYAASVAIAVLYDPQEAQDGQRGFIQTMPQAPSGCPLDKRAVLSALLPEGLAEGRREFQAMLGFVPLTRKEGEPPKRRSQPGVEGFVGQVVTTGPELGCILEWRWVQRDDEAPVCAYDVLKQVGILPYQFENIGILSFGPLTAVNARRLRRETVNFDQYFEDAVIPSEDGLGGRLIPSLEMQTAYPDDLEYGARWTAQVLEQAGRTTEGVAAH